MSQQQFKLGDRVRTEDGREGVVTAYYNDDRQYRIGFSLNLSDFKWCTPDQLTLIEPAQKDESKPVEFEGVKKDHLDLYSKSIFELEKLVTEEEYKQAKKLATELAITAKPALMYIIYNRQQSPTNSSKNPNNSKGFDPENLTFDGVS